MGYTIFKSNEQKHTTEDKARERGEFYPSSSSVSLMSKVVETVCVTGAGGYVASWLVKFLLSKGYFIHGTVRDPEDEKYAHLKKLEKASENLQLLKADLLNYDSLYDAIAGCTGVFHVASPTPFLTMKNPEVELIEPAVMGTLNVLKACSEAKVKRVVVVSSVGAVRMNPDWPKDQVMDEACWSNKEHCKDVKNWYCFSKTAAEIEAWEYAKRNELDVVTVCPSIVVGPLLQSLINSSTLILISLLKDGLDPAENIVRMLVDVRDVAEALLLTYEKPEAEGRYICAVHPFTARSLVEKLRSMYPNFNYPKSFIEVGEYGIQTSEKLQKLGWKYRSLEETLVHAVESYQEFDFLD